MSIISRYTVTSPDFLHIENISTNYVLDYNKKFDFYPIICKGKLHFLDAIVNNKSNIRFSVSGG